MTKIECNLFYYHLFIFLFSEYANKKPQILATLKRRDNKKHSFNITYTGNSRMAI